MQRLRLFSYGTLITGALSSRIDALIADHCIAQWEGWVRGRLFDLGSYPGAVPAARRGERVHGRVLELQRPGQVLPLIDQYEGYDPRAPHKSLYLREVVRVSPANGGPPVEACIYWLNQRPPGRQRIDSGDYRQYLGIGRTSSSS